MPPRRPVRRCYSARIICPDPTCGHVQRSRKWQGVQLATCESCETPFLAWSLYGAAELVGLWPGEPETIDVTRPLPEILDQLGLMESAA